MQETIQNTQYSAVPGRTIIEAAAGIRDIIAAGQNTHNGICLVILDFTRAFDKVSHKYLQRLLDQYNYGDTMKRAVMSLYTNATSRLDINGHRSSDIPIECAISKGCPISSILYALVINPFLKLITRHLREMTIGNGNKKIVCIDYADDITVVCRDERDVSTLQRIIQIYGLTSGAQINWTK
jgi:hypothetical protein